MPPKVSSTALIVIVCILVAVIVVAVIVTIAVSLSGVRKRCKGQNLPLIDGKSDRMNTFIPNTRVPALPKGMSRTVVSDFPLLDIIHNFLSDAEVEHVIRVAESLGFKSSVVVNSKTGDLVTDPTRTSKSVVIPFAHDAVIRGIEAKAAKVSGVPLEYLENLQVVKYEPGQFYKAHHDYLPAETSTVKDHGQRTLTMFAYLNDLPKEETGGGTKFPHLNSYTVRPAKGSSALWHNVTPAGLPDVRTLHSGEPLLNSVKLGMNIWFRDRPQRGLTPA